MKPHAFLVPFAFLAMLGNASAQIQEAWQHPATLWQLSTLGSGMRLIEHMPFGGTTASSRVIRNLDLSVHRVLNYPAPPAGLQWSNMGYITEALFDTDPATIEFVMMATPIGGMGNSAVFVFREDGTEVFSLNPGSMSAMISMNSSYPIFTVDGQSYMLLYTNGPDGPPARLFTLPGTLPCMDCYGSPTASGIGLGEGPGVEAPSGFALFPNPTTASVNAELGTLRADALHVFDAAGQLARVVPVNGQRRVSFTTEGLAAGRFLVMAKREGVSVAALPLVIER
jgi:hypothetical protein